MCPSTSLLSGLLLAFNRKSPNAGAGPSPLRRQLFTAHPVPVGGTEECACLRLPVFQLSSSLRVTPHRRRQATCLRLSGLHQHVYYAAPTRTLHSTTTLATLLLPHYCITLRPPSNTHTTIIHRLGFTNKYRALHILQ